MKRPLVSIIILNFNGLSDTIKCLSSIEKTTYPNYEVLLIDNGSDNNEGTFLQKKYGKKYFVTALQSNLGFTGGNNLAVGKAKGKYVILLNNDAEVSPDWIEHPIDMLEKNKNIAVVQPKIKMLQNKRFFDYAGAAGGFIDKYGYPFTRGRIFETKEKDTGQYDTPNTYPIFWASGAACVIRKSVIKKVGGLFDPIFFNYMEEIDFCWRVWKSGYKVYSCSDSEVFHKGAATAGRDLFTKRYWEHRNNLILLYKNFDGKSSFIWTVRILLEIATYFRYLFTDNVYVRSLFCAHRDFIIYILNTKIKRIKLKNKIPVKLPIFPSSIVLNYYLYKKRLFSKLGWSAKENLNFLIFNPKKSGGLKVIFELVNRFIEKGYNVDVYSVFRTKQNWFPLKTRVTYLPKIFFGSYTNVTIATFWPTSYLLPLIKYSRKYYLVQDWEESFYKNKIIKTLVRYSYKIPAKIITNNRFVSNKIKLFNKNVSVIKIYPVDTKIFNNLKNPSSTTDDNGKIKVVCVISWYNLHKGIDLLDKIIQNIKQRYSNYRFTLVSYEKTKYSDNFDYFISNASPSKTSGIYKNSDVLLVASRNEGTLTTGLEAMACGCILFTTNSPGVNNYAKNNTNAIVVDNIREFWENNIIEKTLKNKGLVNRLRINGYKTAEEYSTKNITAPVEKILFDQK